MSIFDFLCEAKIQDWLKRKDTKEFTPSPKVDKTTYGKPFEGHLLDEVKVFLERAHSEHDAHKKKELLAKANAFEIQLVLSYKTQGRYFLAQHAQNEHSKIQECPFSISDLNLMTLADFGGQDVPYFHVHICGGRCLGPMISP